jgi:hypothetical protein
VPEHRLQLTQLRAEVLLLVQLAEYNEVALAAAAEIGLLPAERVEWLAELERGFDEPEAPPPPAPERREAFERLLEDLGPDLVFDARAVGASLGLVDEYVLGYDEGERLVGFKGAAPGPPERDGKRIISVECYDGGLLLRYEVAYELPDELRGEPDGEVHRHFLDLQLDDRAEIEDDLGTGYQPDGGGGSSGLENGLWVSSWRASYRTPMPPGARRLTVDISGTRFELDVTGIAERPPT